MTFQWAALLLAALSVPVLILLYLWARRRRRPVAARYSSLALIRDATPPRRRVRRHVPFVLVAASVGCLALAMARPTAVVSVPSNQTTIVLSMDVSGSMCSTDIDPTRLEAAEAAAIGFVEAQAADTQIAIVAFSGFAAVIQPPTADRAALEGAIRSLTTGRRTAIGSGILAAIDAIAEIDPAVAPSVIEGRPGVEPTPVAAGAYVPEIVVLLTDGANNAGVDPMVAAQQAADRGVRVFTIGFGTAEGGGLEPECRQQFMGNEPPGGFGGGNGGFGGGQGGFRRGIDEATLRTIAAATGGTYSPAESARELQQVFASLPTTLITKHDPVELTVVFVALGALLAGTGLLLGRLWRALP